MTDSEVQRFARRFYAPGYREVLRRLMALRVQEQEYEE
jgi:hypothetical protein